MARKNQSVIEDLIHLISYLPWWVGALLAPVFYFFLHSYVLKEIPQPGDVQDYSILATSSIFHGLASFGQYIIPLVCILGAMTSAYNQFVRRKLHDKVSQSPMKDVLNDMSWHQFEMLVGEMYRQQGYQVKELGGSGPDGGADLVLTKDGRKYLVQCKQWKAYKVGVQPVRELLGVMVDTGATGGIVVTSGDFTQDAVNFARNNNIQLVDGYTLHEITKGLEKKGVQLDNTSSPPVCKNCGSSMVVRIAKKGATAGQKFWGCAGYPTCRFTLPLEN